MYIINLYFNKQTSYIKKKNRYENYVIRKEFEILT